jgi:sulfatase modifying factor 1
MRLHVVLLGLVGCSSGSSSSSEPPGPATVGTGGGEPSAEDAGTIHAPPFSRTARTTEGLSVPGGSYARMYATTDGGVTAEAALATVSGFQLDEYETTVGRFRGFVTAWNGGAGYLPPTGAAKHAHLNGGQGLTNTEGGFETGWLASNDAAVAPTNDHLACEASATWTPSPGANESLSINCVNWWEAYAFCAWDGGFLPSEAEWEYTAAGGDEERAYPWGATDPGTENAYAIYACNYPLGSGSCLGGPAPVGTAAMGGGRWGQLDLAGNVNEWTLDSYGPYVTPCTDCANLDATSFRVVRGGYFADDEEYLLPTSRSDDAPQSRSACIGFRCARGP